MHTEDNEIRFVSADLPEHARPVSWHLLLNPLYCVDVPVGITDPFFGQLHITRLDCCLVARLTGSAQRWTRTRGLVAASGLKDILIHVCLEGGGSAEVDGRITRLEAGDIGIFDLSRPAVFDLPAFHRLLLILPRRRLATILAHGSPHGLIIPAMSALSRMMRTHLSVMAQLAGTVTSVEAEDMLDASILLLERAVRTLGDLPVDPKTALRATCRLAVMDYIEANLADHQLSPERLVSVFRMSRATLYRLFEEEGGVAALIQTRRLDRCFVELARSGGRGRVVGIGEIAYTYGFGSEAHFSRIFRRRFGISPSAARNSKPAPYHDSVAGSMPDSQRLSQWLSSLGSPATAAFPRQASQRKVVDNVLLPVPRPPEPPFSGSLGPCRDAG
jgi:AraC-like DNA-binding protein